MLYALRLLGFRPAPFFGGIEIEIHETVFAGADAVDTIPRPIQIGRRSDCPAGDLQAAHQTGKYGSRPYAGISTPAVVHALAQYDPDGTIGQSLAFDLNSGADFRVVEEFVGNAPDRGRLNITDLSLPIPVNSQPRGPAGRYERLLPRHPHDAKNVIRPALDSGYAMPAFKLWLGVRCIVRHCGLRTRIPYQRLPNSRHGACSTHSDRSGKVMRCDHAET